MRESSDECAVSHELVTSEPASASALHEPYVRARALTPRDKAIALCNEVIWWHRAFGSPVTYDLVMSRNRERWVASARGDCVRRVRDVTKWSFPRIGKFFDLDHSTCIHHVHSRGHCKVRATLTLESARGLMEAERAKLIAEKPERWAIVVGQPRYSVSENGLIRFDVTGNIRRPQLSPSGYKYVTFQGSPGHKAVFWAVHRMVMEAYVGPRMPGVQVCHKDGNRLNNRLSNLRYGTAKDNAADRDWHGMTCRGVKNGNAKIKDQSIVDEIRDSYASGGVSQYELAGRFGVSQAQINNIVLNKQHVREEAMAGPYPNEGATQ